MGELIRHPATAAAAGEPLAAAVDQFLDHVRFHGSGSPDTIRVYRQTLEALAEFVTAEQPAGRRAATADLTAATVERFMKDRYGGAAPATWNKNRSILRSFAAWCLRREILTSDPTRLVDARTNPGRDDQSLPMTRIDKLIEAAEGLREKTLWSMLYATAARASEILGLDVEDLDREQRRARIRAKGGAIEYVYWDTRTARLLAKLVSGRKSGPVYLTERRAGTGTRAPAPADIDPGTGRSRLSYERAERLFKVASLKQDPHAEGWTFHRLRHSALTHAAERGRSAFEIQAKARHKNVATSGRYVRLGADTAERMTAEDDPANRTRR